jgi:hypothetical protein
MRDVFFKERRSLKVRMGGCAANRPWAVEGCGGAACVWQSCTFAGARVTGPRAGVDVSAGPPLFAVVLLVVPPAATHVMVWYGEVR